MAASSQVWNREVSACLIHSNIRDRSAFPGDHGVAAGPTGQAIGPVRRDPPLKSRRPTTKARGRNYQCRNRGPSSAPTAPASPMPSVYQVATKAMDTSVHDSA